MTTKRAQHDQSNGPARRQVMTLSLKDIHGRSLLELFPVRPNDFDDFKVLRMRAMRRVVDRQGLPWDEAQEHKYHVELFNTPGLMCISCDGFRAGYVGMHDDNGTVTLSRFVIDPIFQNQQIGASVFNKIISDPQWGKRDVYLDVLTENEARTFFERQGFVQYDKKDGEEKYAYYRRPATPSRELVVATGARLSATGNNP